MKNEEPDVRLIGYARVSTDDQDLSLQRRALMDYGIPEYAIYEEHASGGRMDRPQLFRALRPLHPGDTFVVWKLDRLGRTLPGVLEVLERIDNMGVKFVSLTENWDTSSGFGKAMLHMALTFAQLERDLISERTKAGMQAAKERGAKFGRGHSIVDVPERLNAIRPLVEDGRADDMTPEQALDFLNRAAPKAPPIRSKETWRRWRRDGYKGID